MKYYYQFRAVIAGAKGVGVRSILSSLDPQADNNIVQLNDKISETLYIYEFCKDELYLQDALCFIVVSDQTEKSIQFAKQKIQIILKQLNRTYQFAVFVCNKIDQQVAMQDELEQFCAINQINFISLSAKIGTNVQLLTNLLKIKAQLIMKKCSIEPFQLESNREREFGSITTPDRPLPKTPKSSDDKENRSDYKSINSETVESFRAVEILDERTLQRHQNSQITQTQNSSVLQSTKRAYLDMSSSCRLKSPISKKLMVIEIEFNNQIYHVDVYQDDSYALIVERVCISCQKKVKQQIKRNLMCLIESQIECFMQQFAAQFQDKRYLKVKEQYEKFVVGHNQKIITPLEDCKSWKDPHNALGLIIIIIQSQLIRIYVHKNDEPYDLAFNSIVDYNLKKNCIGALVNKIKFMQTNKNIQILGFFDFTNHEFIVYNGENTQNYFNSSCQTNQTMNIIDSSHKYSDLQYKIQSLMNRRLKTEITERHLDYNLNYDSIIIINDKEEQLKQDANPQTLFSLQFYGKRQVNQSKQPQCRIFRPPSRQPLSSLKKAKAIYAPSDKPTRIHAQPSAFRIKPMNLKLNLNLASKQSLHTPSTRLYDSQHPSGSQTPLDLKIPFSKIQQILSSSTKQKGLQIDFNKFKKSIY